MPAAITGSLTPKTIMEKEIREAMMKDFVYKFGRGNISPELEWIIGLIAKVSAESKNN